MLDESDTEDGGRHGSAQLLQQQQHDRAHVRAPATGQQAQAGRPERSATPPHTQQAGGHRHMQPATVGRPQHMGVATAAQHKHTDAAGADYDRGRDKEDGSGFNGQLPPGAFLRRGNLTGNLTGLNADLDGEGAERAATASDGADAAAPPHKKLKLKLPRRPVSASSDAYDESWYTEHLDRQPDLQGPIADLAQVHPLLHHRRCPSSTTDHVAALC